jgi:hypothetical protein
MHGGDRWKIIDFFARTCTNFINKTFYSLLNSTESNPINFALPWSITGCLFCTFLVQLLTAAAAAQSACSAAGSPIARPTELGASEQASNLILYCSQVKSSVRRMSSRYVTGYCKRRNRMDHLFSRLQH